MKNNILALNIKTKNEDLKKIKLNHSYWEKNAEKFKTNYSVSWPDKYIIEMEIKNIRKYIKNGNYVLDAGCSNGFSTFAIASGKKIRINAFDYSKKSIFYAKREQKNKDKQNSIHFYHGNILNINEADNTFDKAYTVRVIINLLSWELQKNAILEIHRILKPGGYFLMSEAFIGSYANINGLRKLANLPPLAIQNFNLYLIEARTEKFLKKYFDIVEINKFSSLYYVGSRFFRYLTMDNNQKDSFINPINKYFSGFKKTTNSGDFGIQKLYILRKK